MPKISNVEVSGLERAIRTAKYPKAVDLESLDSELTKGIKSCANCKTGEGHDNFLKGIIVHFDMTFSNKAWVEAERYHWLEFVSSQSTMHKITAFDLKKQCNDYVDENIINTVQGYVDKYLAIKSLPKTNDPIVAKTREDDAKYYYLKALYNCPAGFELTAGMVTNYLQLKTIYQQRRHHRLPDWWAFCDWCETLPMFKELCIDRNGMNN